jgi:hypothetical protein
MVSFNNEKKEEITKVEPVIEDIFYSELEKTDTELDNESNFLDKLNKTMDRTDDSVMLSVHVSEARKYIVGLREHLTLCEMYRERMKIE